MLMHGIIWVLFRLSRRGIAGGSISALCTAAVMRKGWLGSGANGSVLLLFRVNDVSRRSCYACCRKGVVHGCCRGGWDERGESVLGVPLYTVPRGWSSQRGVFGD